MSVSFPTTLHLEQRQKDAINAWFEALPIKKLEDFEEAVPSSSVTFHVYATGLGDSVSAWTYSYFEDGYEVLFVSIDDDNEMHPSRYWSDGNGLREKTW